MNKHVIHCDCCQGLMGQVGMYRQFQHLRCKGCGHERFLSKKESISAELYEEDADYNADLAIAQNHKDLLQWNHIQAIPQLQKLSAVRPLRILDIGCFNGFFVKELRDNGFDAEGIDFNRKALAFGKLVYKLDGHLSARTLADLEQQGEQYDAVTMFEVIEHLEDFAELIEQAIKLLKPMGVIILSTPNSKMSWRPTLDSPPHHLSRFSPTSMQRLMKRLGLTVLYQAEQTSSFDLIRNLIGSLLRKKSAKSMRGGQFRHKDAANNLRVIANRSKWLIYKIVVPIDFILHKMGLRYISQIIVAQKRA